MVKNIVSLVILVGLTLILSGCISNSLNGNSQVSSEIEEEFELKFGESLVLKDSNVKITFAKHVPDCLNIEEACAQKGIFFLTEEIDGITYQYGGQNQISKGETKEVSREGSSNKYKITLDSISGWGVDAVAYVRVSKIS